VFEKLEKIIKPATEKVITTAEQYSTSLRTWAYIVALKRILDVSKITK
jgi:glutamate dehydrogenase/leucine dehydrogenase